MASQWNACFTNLSGSWRCVGFINGLDFAEYELRKEEIRGVLAELSECVELKLGLNVFVEQSGGLYPSFALNIWYSDVSKKWSCFDRKLRGLGLSFRYVERGLFTYFQVYTP